MDAREARWLTFAVIAMITAGSLATTTSDGAAQCDPTCGSSPAPVPPRLARHCGDGRVGTYAESCERTVCGGCGHAATTSFDCEEREELCDGHTVRATCTELGFAGGTMGCASDCAALDTRGCQPCFAGPGVSCGATALTGLVDVQAVMIAPSAAGISTARGAASTPAEVGVLFSAHRGTRVPEDGWTDLATVFVAVLAPDLSVRAAPREVMRTDFGGTIAATSAGFLVATTDGTHARVYFVDPRSGAVRHCPSADALGLPVDLEPTSNGVTLLMRREGEAYPVTLLDARGAPTAWPAGPVHARGPLGRIVVVPMGDGALAMPQRYGGGALVPPGSVATHAGDRLVVLAGGQLGAQNEVEVQLFRGGARVDGYRGDSGSGAPVGPLPMFDLALPGGGRITLNGDASAFDDIVTDPSGAALLHVTGATTAPAPSIPVFGGRGVEPLSYTSLGESTIGLALHATRLEGGIDSGLTGLRLLVARVTP